MEISWTFLIIFAWCYIGFFLALYDWYITFRKWDYSAAFLGAFVGPFMILTYINWLPLPKPTSVTKNDRV